MLDISQAQLDALKKVAEDKFVSGMLDYFYAHAPAWAQGLGRDKLEALMRSGIERSAEHYITQESDVARYLQLMQSLGPNFDQDIARAREILDSPQTAQDRLNDLQSLVPGSYADAAKILPDDLLPAPSLPSTPPSLLAAPTPAAAPVAAPAPSHCREGGEVGSPVQKCKPSPPKVTLLELVEVVRRGDEGVVTGAGDASPKLATLTARSAKNGGAFKQYINLDKDVEGAGKRHPDYGRYVEVKARLTCVNGPISGHAVTFSYSLTPGPVRPANMTGGVAEGFGALGGAKTTTSSSDAEGWTGTVRFYLSQYAGDQFTISAKAAEDATTKATGTFEVWRRFWYQKTRATTHVVPEPDKSVTAYDKLNAEMVAGTEVTYAKAAAPANTFYPAWMVKIGGSDDEHSVIGGHNKADFYKKLNEKPEEPVKGHLIMCQHQWDPFGESDLLTVPIDKTPSDPLTLTLAGGAFNAGILKPALKGDLIVIGTWSQGTHSGNLTADNILIEKARTGLNVVRVSLPAGAPVPTAAAKVTVKLKLRFGKFYAGESVKKQMLIVYDADKATAAAQFNQVVSHEFGHGFGQTPLDGKQVAPLPKHAKAYNDAHGGQGPHCSTDATEVADTLTTSGKRFVNGTCIMFHQVNPSGCKQLFCPVCEPHLRIQNFSALGGT